MPPNTPATNGYDELHGLMTLMTGDEKHDASATSTLDVIWALYHDVLEVDPRHPDDPDRDRFLLSKGHGPMAYYAVLAAHGFISTEELPVSVPTARVSATTPTAPWYRGSRSALGPSATGWRSPSAAPSG